ncbi:ABC transporter permease [Spirillospora sp. NPDC029432]|uniref:ABC transporter permease n=1 Tax=Spirillospora sp. NPDC029432 TaxID=3154599 RepID=UPI003456A5D2
MIWLAWRQFRTPAAVLLAALAALAAVLAITGPGLADDHAAGLAGCTAQGDCSAFTRGFFNDHRSAFAGLIAVVVFLPGVIGLFWGAPLVAREVETGTHRLVWNQSVTRTRWLAVKLTLTGVTAVLVTGLTVLAVSWWSEPIERSAGREFPRLTPLLFDARGIVPLAYAAFAFALGVAVGMLVRRTLPAMAITLAVFAAVQLAMPLLVRPHLLPPTEVTATVTPENVGEFMSEGPGNPIQVKVRPSDEGAWILSQRTVDASGRTVKHVGLTMDSGPCDPHSQPESAERPGPPKRCLDEINERGYRQVLTYHPSSRFWPLQWAEAGVYAVLTLGLTGFCFWWIRRRMS